MSTTLLLARHGQTADNANHVFQGQSGSGLDASGRAQARRLAARVARAGLSAVVSSDLERALETARIVAAAVGVEPSIEAGLREIDVGQWTGKSHREVEALHPEEWAAWVAGIDVRRGGGETYAELAERIDGALGRVVAAHEGGRVLVVSHGGAIRSWVGRLLGLSVEGMRVLGGVANTSLTAVERDGRGFRLHAWNDTAHLEGMGASEESD